MFKIGDRVKVIGKNEYCDKARQHINYENLYIVKFNTPVYFVCRLYDNQPEKFNINVFNLYEYELVLHKKILEDV